MAAARAPLTDEARRAREKKKRLHAQVQKLALEVKKLRKELHYAHVALSSREAQLAFFERAAAQ